MPTTAQAIAEAGLVDEFPQMCSSAFSYLERTQILCSAAARVSDAFGFEGPAMRRRYFRHVSEGEPVSQPVGGWVDGWVECTTRHAWRDIAPWCKVPLTQAQRHSARRGRDRPTHSLTY